MLVKNEIKNDVYNKLINYIFDKSDIISVTVYNDQHSEANKKVRTIIMSVDNNLINSIINNYNEDKLEIIYKKFHDNELIFDKDYVNRWENSNYDSYLKELNRHSVITSSIMNYIYEINTNNWINKYKDIIIKKNEILLNSGVHHSTIYYLKLNNEIKNELILKNSIFNWCYPSSIEDICFFKNGYCWLYSVTHEKICDIYCENKEEYEYLKSIGIEFLNDDFVPTPKDKLYFENYIEKN